jgi:hypothetical protein
MLGIGKLGYLALDFIREAPNAFEAVTSAIANIKQAIPEAALIEATPDLGGISDTARNAQNDFFDFIELTVIRLSRNAARSAALRESTQNTWIR